GHDANAFDASRAAAAATEETTHISQQAAETATRRGALAAAPLLLGAVEGFVEDAGGFDRAGVLEADEDEIAFAAGVAGHEPDQFLEQYQRFRIVAHDDEL